MSVEAQGNGGESPEQFDVDVTDKASKKRRQMSEVGIYAVKEGKVSREEFLPLAGEEQ
jgi:hypothetical protein